MAISARTWYSPVETEVGSANDSANAWTKNYELVWEDDDPESVAWLQEEFDALWAKGFCLSEFIIKQLGRLGQRTVIEHVGAWKRNPKPEPVLAEVPTATELFGFWDHQKYFINLGFGEHLKYKDDPDRGARFLRVEYIAEPADVRLPLPEQLIRQTTLAVLILRYDRLRARCREPTRHEHAVHHVDVLNEIVAVPELAFDARASFFVGRAILFRGVVLATGAMLIRNLLILGMLAPRALLDSVVPLTLMLGGTATVILLRGGDASTGWRAARPAQPAGHPEGEPGVPALQSPFSCT